LKFGLDSLRTLASKFHYPFTDFVESPALETIFFFDFNIYLFSNQENDLKREQGMALFYILAKPVKIAVNRTVDKNSCLSFMSSLFSSSNQDLCLSLMIKLSALRSDLLSEKEFKIP